jgi:ribosomal protein S18 acetylase RimI-like enzyme
MELRPFSADDWSWVQEWYQDALLDRELGPMDTDWLDAVLAERDGVQLVAMIEATPIALIGCVWGTEQHPSHHITDIAVAPSMRGQGLASKVLHQVVAWPGHPYTSKWTAFVNPRNLQAQSLLRKNLWAEVGVFEGMMHFEKSITT